MFGDDFFWNPYAPRPQRWLELTGVYRGELDEHRRILVDAGDISRVVEMDKKARLVMKSDRMILDVNESFEDVMKRLGLSISPRAETIALK
jgi:hypothetical protein